MILELKNLKTVIKTDEGTIYPVNDVSLSLKKGEILGLVGESGSGKSMTALSILDLLPKPIAEVESGKIIFNNEDLVQLKDKSKIRGEKISVIFQSPMNSLNPVYSIEKQMLEVYDLHFPSYSKEKRRANIISLFDKVGIRDSTDVLRKYPHQLSGGIVQRVMIAMALACEPEILIADEPTTALDVTIQAQILKLISDLQKQNDMGVIFITHDLAVVAQICDKVAVMYGGKIVEYGTVQDILQNPLHPYTKGLIACIPSLETTAKSELYEIKGTVPNFHNLPKGCAFYNRCDYAQDQCKQEIDLNERKAEHLVRCIKEEL